MGIKKIIILVSVIIPAVIVSAVFIYRHQIVKYSIETIIRNNLPPYIKIDSMSFDLAKGKAEFKGLKISNPDGFSNPFMLEIRDIKCRFRTRGRNILKGIEILDPVFTGASLDVDRLEDRRVNLAQMQKVMENASSEKAALQPSGAAGPGEGKKENRIGGIVRLSDIVKLPEEFTLRNGSITFIDRAVYPAPHMITFENIDAKFLLKLDDAYTKVLGFSSTGKGNLNGNSGEVVEWTVSLDPKTPRLTMSNRFEVSGADIVSFEPYYDKYSPFVFKRGTFSGTLILDFDNGNIGSTNEVHLSGLVFYIKQGYENALFWETTVPELQKYFTSPSGDIVFDFKIKGDMADPKFSLGPISKRALAAMAIDKVATVIQKVSQKGASEGASGNVSDYIGLFDALLKKR